MGERDNEADRLLVVDHDEQYAEIIRATLRQNGMDAYDIELATSVNAAVALLRDHLHEVVIIDQGLPGNPSALDLARALRKIRPDVAIIMTTETRLTVAEVVACFQAGADEFIEKPFHPLEFAARVAAVVRRAKRSTHEVVPEPLSA